LVGFGGLMGCGSGDEPPNPLATRNGFCAEWAKRACNDRVVDACAASSAEACREAQEVHCQSVVSSEAYNERSARGCLDAVRTALSNAQLTAEQAGIVLRGEAACSFLCVEVSGGGCVEPTLVGGGEECSSEDTLCDQGFYCDGSNCLARRSVGAECSEDRPCKEDLKCVEDGDQRACVEKLAIGAPCDADDDCRSGMCAGVCSNNLILSAGEPTCTKFR
jgi:hypothetical protein